MYTILLGVALSAGAQAQGNVYFGYPGCGFYGGCYCAPVMAYPVAVSVPVVASRSDAERTIANLRKRLKSLEEKFAQTEPQVKLTREALVELANKVERIDENIKIKEPQFIQMLKELNGRINGLEDTINTKEPLIKAKLDELGDRMKGVEGGIKGLEDATKPALEQLTKRVKKVEKTLKQQEAEKKEAAIKTLADQVKKLDENLTDRVKRVEDRLRTLPRAAPAPRTPVQPTPVVQPTPPPQPPAAPTENLRSSLDRFIDRLQKVEVQMKDDAKIDAVLERLGRIEGTLGTEQQKLQSAIDALRAFSENVDKGFLNMNSRLRQLEESQRFMPPAKEPEIKKELDTPKIEPQAPQSEPGEPKKDAADDGFGLVPPAPTATLIVNVPAEARVFLNGQRTQSTGNVRSFATPKLENGKNYAYEVRAELTRDGATVVETRQVRFQAGSRVNISFADLGDSALTKLRTVRAE